MVTKRNPAKGTLAWELKQQRNKRDKGWDQKGADELAARGETFHYGTAKVVVPPTTKESAVEPTLNLIKAANKADRTQLKQQAAAYTMMMEYAEESKTSVQELAESVTHILANIATTASSGAPLKLMHLNSIASFMAGVEAIAKALPSTQDEVRKQNTLRVLTAAGVQPDGTVSYAVTPIAQLGARKQDIHGKYAAMVQDYAASTARGEPAGQELAQAARMLQAQIDRAMRQAAAPQNKPAAAGPSMTGSSPSSI